MYKCDIIRRVPNYEDVFGDDTFMEKSTSDLQEIMQDEQGTRSIISDEIDDYADNVDDVYGGYGLDGYEIIKTVQRIEIIGSDTIPEQSTTQYICEAYYSDGSTEPVIGEWSITDYATISDDGVVTTGVHLVDVDTKIMVEFDGLFTTLDLVIKASDEFSTTWSIPSDDFDLDLSIGSTGTGGTGGGEHGDVDWGDGTITPFNDSDMLLTHTYSTMGEYTVEITGLYTQMPKTTSYSSPIRSTLKSVNQLGRVGWTTLENAFNRCRQLESFTNHVFDISGVSNMSGMFDGCTSLNNVDVSHIDTTNIVDMSNMFNRCVMVTQLDVSHFNIDNVTDISNMFNSMYRLETIDVSNWNTSNVVDMSNLFCYCTDLIELDISNFDTSNVVNMGSMFEECYNITSLDVSSFNTSNVVDMSYIFSHCHSLLQLDVSNFDTSNVIYMDYMFNDLFQVDVFDVSNFQTNNVTSFEGMFRLISRDPYDIPLDVSHFNTGNAINMSHMFDSVMCFDIQGNTSHWDMNNVDDISYMFNMGDVLFTNTEIKSLDLTTWNLPRLRKMDGVFKECGHGSIDISTWDVTDVESMNYVFESCRFCDTINISGWDMSYSNYNLPVTSMRNMFNKCYVLENIVVDFTQWYMMNVTDMRYMFNDCNELTSLDLNGWEFQYNIQCDHMFNGCELLTSIDLSDWQFTGSKILNMNSMFNDCESITSIDLSSFDTTDVVDMSYLFNGCTNLTHLDISSFSVGNVVDFSYMFNMCTNLSYIDISWSISTTKSLDMTNMYNGCSELSVWVDIFDYWNNPTTITHDNCFTDCFKIQNYVYIPYTWNGDPNLGRLTLITRNESYLNVSNYDESIPPVGNIYGTSTHHVSKDGSKLIVQSNVNYIDRFNQFTIFDLGTPYQLIPHEYGSSFSHNSPYELSGSTMVEISTSSLPSDVISDISDVKLSPDGFKLYLTQYNTGSHIGLHQYSMSSAFDLSTLSLDHITTSMNGGVIGTPTSNIEFSHYGDKLYVIESINSVNVIYEYKLSTPWDVSTNSYHGDYFTIPSEFGNLDRFSINAYGTSMVCTALDRSPPNVYEFAITSSWSIETSLYKMNKSFNSHTSIEQKMSYVNNTTLYAMYWSYYNQIWSLTLRRLSQ